VTIEDTAGLLTISAVNLPSKHTVKQEQLEDYYNILGYRFIEGDDYNANILTGDHAPHHPEDEK
jgi:hypothetical protein